jgi:hypothetical protein
VGLLLKASTSPTQEVLAFNGNAAATPAAPLKLARLVMDEGCSGLPANHDLCPGTP